MHSSVYERINPATRASLLTTSSNEANAAAKSSGYSVNMGTPFRASATAGHGLSQVVRLTNRQNHDAFWTTSKNEAYHAATYIGYQIIGTSFYAAAAPTSCDIPVYRYRHAGLHRFTTSAPERKSLAAAGWTYEGIAFYGAPTVSASQPSPSPHTTSAAHSASSTKPAPSPKPTASRPSTTASPSPSPHPSSSATSGGGSQSVPPAGSSGSGPLARPIYAMTGTQAWAAYQKATDATTKRELYQIAATPGSLWLGGASTDESHVDQVESAAVAQGKTPVFVLYAIPHRDCGGYSGGGLTSVNQYENWVDSVRRGIAGRPAVVIVEPDAIGWGCLSASDQASRIAMLKYALQTLSQDPKTWAYVHAGSSGLNPRSIADNLKQIGIEHARGFAINVSSFDSTASEIAYGKAIDAALGMQKHFVIDTSRNGLGRDGVSNSCNPPGRAVGSRPTTQTADPLVDAYLWIKIPGGSDGSCHPGDPGPGQWFQSYALDLVQRAISAGIIQNWALPE